MTPSKSARWYADQVVSGKIPAGQYVRLACQRFIDDLARKDWDYYYDSEKADRAVRFEQLMPHTKGKWAAKGEKLVLEPWQCFIECNLFGWVSKTTGLRRFRMAYEEEPRKSGKSIRIAARGLYLFAADGEAGAEVYSGATTEKQAMEVYRVAWQMAQKLPAMRERFGIDQSGNPKNPGPMYVMEDMSKFEAMIGKPGDGSSPHAALIDEYHEHETDHMVDAMQTGMGAREQPMLCIITTAGTNLNGPCYEMRRDVIRILEKEVEDETVFGVIFGLDNEPYDIVYQLSDSLQRIGILCKKQDVDVAEIAQYFLESYVSAATIEQGRKSNAISRVETIPTESNTVRDIANPATTRTLLQLIQTIKSVRQQTQGSGLKITQKKQELPRKNGTISSRAKESVENIISTLSLSALTELNLTITSLCSMSKAGNASYAESLKKVYASIIAMPQEILEVFCANSAILASAFSETISKACKRLSNTSGTIELSSQGLQLLEKVPPDAWDDPASLIKANPNYGVSVFEPFLLSQLEQAKRSSSKQNAFRTKHLNDWVGAKTAWMNMLAWQRQKRSFEIADFAGCKCYIGGDLASKLDVAAILMIFEKDGAFYLIPRFYVPEKAVSNNAKYLEFVSSGEMIETPGEMTDYAFIEEDLKELLAQGIEVIDIGFDPSQATYLITRLASAGINVVEIAQTVRNLSEPMKELEAMIISRKLWQDGNKAMTWMMGNVVAKIDAKEHIYPRKERPENKIDGPVAAIIAMNRMMAARETEKAPLMMFTL